MRFGITLQQTVTQQSPNHSGDMPEGTLKAVLTQAGISTEEFLRK
ncbi:type II toxin-antitoxin system HicA family toxin [Beggiatoa leptomitoformis]|nr:type II toxin-antitoxin system HicA family toxin [Beggiatoa leptomitoformis]